MTRTTGPVACFDSGLLGGKENSAIDRLALQRHARRELDDSLRFYRTTPAASLGVHQAIDRELRLEYCRSRGIEVLRRPSGGGAIYADPDQLGFSLILEDSAGWSLLTALERGCQVVSRALVHLGIAADYKYPNDVQVDGRKIASVFVARDGGSLLLQGTLLLGVDIKTLLEVLRAPTEKLSADGLAAARDRLVTLKELLGRIPEPEVLQDALRRGFAEVLGRAVAPVVAAPAAWQPAAGALEQERELAGAIEWSARETDWVEALWKSGGTTVRLRARFTADGRRFSALAFSGDMIADPPTVFRALARLLAGAPAGKADEQVDAFFAQHPAELPGLSPQDIKRLLHLAIEKQAMRRHVGVTSSQANAVMVFSPDGPRPMESILQQASVMLVPYCAKPAWCKWRHLDGCTECGLCEVGNAYRLARERGMRVVTVTNYEHLVSTFEDMKNEGTRSYVGMCCSNFFIKRHYAFADAGMPSVLMDISGANCYELKQEGQAYAGQFKAQARLDADLLGKVMRFVPPAKSAEESGG